MKALPKISGIHHVSAIGTNTKQSIDFYTNVLGFRLIKQTVKFDEPHIRQLVFGDEKGTAKNTLFVFPTSGLKQGRHGVGMLNTTAFSVPLGSIDFWISRLEKLKIPYKSPQKRFEEDIFIYLEDRDGLGLELVFNDRDGRKGYENGNIGQNQAIRGFYNVEIWEKNYVGIGSLLSQKLDYRLIAEQGNRRRYAAIDTPGNYVDVLSTSDAPKGLKGYGTIHRLAFATPNVDTLFELRESLKRSKVEVSFIIDKKYFQAIYFETSSGVGIEISTENPGFTIDETVENLGKKLMLPMQFEWQRETLEGGSRQPACRIFSVGR